MYDRTAALIFYNTLPLPFVFLMKAELTKLLLYRMPEDVPDMERIELDK